MKQTARNNEFLEEVKVVVNNKIYKEVLRIYNEQGMEQTIEYLNQFFNTHSPVAIFCDPMT
jgi:hypothetical protein